MTDQMREEFEQWGKRRHGLSMERWADSGEYKYHDTRNWWECWQAALTSAQGGAEGRDGAIAGTSLGERLHAIRQKAIDNGLELQPATEILREREAVADRRSW